MKKSTLDYKVVSAAKDNSSTDGKEIWQFPELNEIEYKKTHEGDGPGNDDDGFAES